MTLNSGDQLKYFDYEKRKVMDSTNILNEESCMGKCSVTINQQFKNKEELSRTELNKTAVPHEP